MIRTRLMMRGLVACGAALVAIGAAANAQNARQDPPARGEGYLPAYTPRTIQAGRYVDHATGTLVEIHAPVEPILIPPGGLLPTGTLPDPDREAGRPMRPGGDVWIPDGTGYWPPAVEDEGGDVITLYPLHQNFEGPGYNGLTPPDPDMARGYDYEVCVTNDDFAVYDTCGTRLFYSDINDYLNNPAFLYDCKIIFDPWEGRWVMMYHEKDDDPQVSKLDIIVSADDLPFGIGSSWYYRFEMLQDGGTSNAAWADYFDLGYSSTQLYASGNMFKYAGGYRWARLRVFDKAAVYAGAGAASLSFSGLTNPDGSQTDTPRSAKMQSSIGVDGLFINSRWGGGNKITIWKLTDAFGANTLTKTDITVGNYTPPPDATQPSGEKLDTIDSRLMSAVLANDTLGSNGQELFTGMTTEYQGQAACLLYKFDPVANALKWERVFWGADRDYWFPSSASDYSGSNFWVFTRCSFALGEFASVRFVEMDRGVFTNSSSAVKVGTGNYGGHRWGDYFGGQLDWGDYSANLGLSGRPSKVWLYGEYGKNNDWGTHVGASSVFDQGTISNVTPTTTFVITGPEGGPFSPTSRTYTLASASGDPGTAFTVTSLPTWLDASRTYGQVWGNTTVQLSVNSNANSLRAGTYTDSVLFNDCLNGGATFTRTVQLIVQADCYADYNGDGVVDTRDVLAFLNDWTAGNKAADCDGNNVIDTRDVLCFLNLWTSGC